MEYLTACEEHTWIQKSSLIQSIDNWQFSSLGTQRKQEIKKKIISSLSTKKSAKISHYCVVLFRQNLQDCAY